MVALNCYSIYVIYLYISSMAIHDIYSKRQKRINGELPDVYRYYNIPEPLRVQIIYIMNDALGSKEKDTTLKIYKHIHDVLCREYGKFSLLDGNRKYSRAGYVDQVQIFLLECEETNHILDVVETTFQLIDTRYRDYSTIYATSPKLKPDEAIQELNSRFNEHGVGYQYESGSIIRIDSQLIHTEATKPALNLLSDSRFKGANEEFLKAHEHYRHGRYKECLVECLKAFESTMKIICDTQGWTYQTGDTASKLIDLCFQNNLIPNYLQSQFTALKTNLSSGIPTLRNKNAGHGQGSQQINVPEYFAAYQLHITASTILFLIEAEKALP